MKWLVLTTFSAAVLIFWQYQSAEVEVNVPSTPSSQLVLGPLLKVDIDGENQAYSQLLATGNWLNSDTRSLFDYFAAMFVQSEEVMWRQFNQYCAPLNYCLSLTELYKRYLAYKVRLGEIDDSPLRAPQEFAKRLADIKSLRSTIFSPPENQALFADEEIWHKYAIDRMQINQDPNLNDGDKMILLEQHIASLPDAMKASILPTLNLRKITQLREQNQEWGEANYNLFSAEFGPDVAQRLVNVENAQQQWLAKVRVFLWEKEQLATRFSHDTEGYQQALQDAEIQMFKANERRRLKVYLSNQSLVANSNY